MEKPVDVGLWSSKYLDPYSLRSLTEDGKFSMFGAPIKTRVLGRHANLRIG